MKNTDWCLLIGNKKISNIRQLRENFDTAVLVGYYLGGSLKKWLDEAGEASISRRIDEINPNYDISEQLEYAFGVRPDKRTPEALIRLRPEPVTERKEPPKKPVVYSFMNNNSSFNSSFPLSSFMGSSFNASSFLSSSFYASSFLASSFMNNFYKGSFSVYSSFLSFSLTGSFTSSFTSSFLNLLSSSFASSYNMFAASSGSFYGGSFTGGMTENGSFVFKIGEALVTETEYKKTMINLSSCPLNSYGYGINLI